MPTEPETITPQSPPVEADAADPPEPAWCIDTLKGLYLDEGKRREELGGTVVQLAALLVTPGPKPEYGEAGVILLREHEPQVADAIAAEIIATLREMGGIRARSDAVSAYLSAPEHFA